MNILGTTEVVALLGYPVGHSLSPKMHNAAFESLGLDLCYVAFEVTPKDLRAALEGVRALGLVGLNITVPHKETVMQMLNEVDSEAAFIGAVNTVVNLRGKLKGFNTDGRGFMRALAEEGFDLSGKRVLVLGAGGAARAISVYLCEEAGEVHIYNRTTSKSERLVSDLSINYKGARLAPDLSQSGEMDFIINATSLGLGPKDPLPMDIAMLRKEQNVIDLIYKNTPFLREAQARGCRTMNGLNMLLWQGGLAFELWTGQEPPIDVMRKVMSEQGIFGVLPQE